MAKHVFSGLGLLGVEELIQKLYEKQPSTLEADLATVRVDRDFHRLVSSGLLEQDRAVFEQVNPYAAYAVVAVNLAFTVAAVDKLQTLGYDARVYLPVPRLASAAFPPSRKETLLLWVCRQSSLREGRQKARTAQRYAMAIALLEGEAPGVGQALVPPERLLSHAVSEMSVLAPDSLLQSELGGYIQECSEAGLRVTVDSFEGGHELSSGRG